MRRPLDSTLSPHVRGMMTSPAVRIADRCDAMRARGDNVYKLVLGQSPFPIPDRMVDALRVAAAEKEYLPAQGLPALRRAIAAHVERRLGVDRTGEDVLVGPGSKELVFLLQIAFNGDLLIPTPAWVSYVPQARVLGREVVMLPTRREDQYLLRPDDLAAVCERGGDRPRLLVLNYPSNPTGLTYRADELRELARVAQKHGVLLLADEIYAELHHKGQHASIARWYPEGTILSTGISKWLGAGGWRLGAFVFPQELRGLLDAMACVASETYTSTSAPVQHAAVVAFEGGEDIDRYLQQVRRVLAALGRWSARRLVAAGIDCAQPVGAFYVFPDFGGVGGAMRARGITTSTGLCEALLDETGVALLPGSVFGRPEEELTARLAYVDFDGARALSAVSVIPREQPLDETFLRRHCARVVEAVERIVGWVRR
ncbi:pyridoxal phosphate-dependent aminotransferase [Sandaracinus amylolyticus]|nr:aminotransferase class I/II-fold pyridoxal phosphate-dependent enzyme [Sandaracinus amylolyticus]